MVPSSAVSDMENQGAAMRISKLWLRPLMVFAHNLGKLPEDVIARALFNYWRTLQHDDPDSLEGQSAKHALDTILSQTHVPK